jgi:hypothetical protein
MPNPSRKHFTSLSRIARICALFLILVGGAAKEAVSDDLRKIALVVGNSGYENITHVPIKLKQAVQLQREADGRGWRRLA